MFRQRTPGSFAVLDLCPAIPELASTDRAGERHVFRRYHLHFFAFPAAIVFATGDPDARFASSCVAVWIPLVPRKLCQRFHGAARDALLLVETNRDHTP